MIFRAVSTDIHSLKQYRKLFEECFPKSSKFSLGYLRWLYEANPEGQAVGFNAYDGDELAAHYVCVPGKFIINGKIERTLLSLNTATHPKHQGKGLFTKLAEKTYEAGIQLGFHSVHGVANANSTPGFIRKLGFQLVEQLKAKIGLGRILTSSDFKKSVQPQFKRIWTPEAIAWRCSNPDNPVRRCNGDELAVFQARSVSRCLPVYAELDFDVGSALKNQMSMSPLHLYLGLQPDSFRSFRTYVDIPSFVRPSPLNLIFRDLTAGSRLLEKGEVSFSFLDFDVY